MTLMKIAGKQLAPLLATLALLILSALLLQANMYQVLPQEVDDGLNVIGNFVEGPHVFYKKGKVTIKKVQFSGGKATLQEHSYENREEIPTLVCSVDDKRKTSFTVNISGENYIPPTYYQQPEKLFAISDIEGHFEAFARSLKGNGIIDYELNWSYGDGHLVLVGDFFDRGHNVTPVLWLIYKLEKQAALAGGMVHFIVGNHEEMNMRGDLRYVKDRYIKAARVMRTSYPNLYSNETELGRWLRSKNVVEKIGNTIFVHGGLSNTVARSRIRLEEMNKYARSHFGTEKWRLEQKGGGAAAVFSKNGPMWYRGYFDETVPQQDIDNTLHLYGAKHVVVGHTIVPRISSLRNGKVIAIDVKHDIALSEKIANALLFEHGQMYAVNINGTKSPVESFMTEQAVVKVFRAVRDGDIPSVEKFIRPSGRINKHYFSKRITLLQAAIHHNQPNMVRMLLAHGADIEMLSENKTPLMHAVLKNNRPMANLLILNGANVNALNRQKKTPLFFCAKNGNVEMAKFLVKNGARVSQKDGKGRTAAEYAMKNNNLDVAQFLFSCKD